MKFILTLPPTTNQQYGTHGKIHYLTAESKAWLELSRWKLKVLNHITLLDEVSVTAHFYLKRDRDVDNLKLVLDVMKGYVYEDDAQVVELHVYKHKDKMNPRVELEVFAIDSTA